MQTTREKQIGRQYTREFLTAMIVYSVTLVASIWLIGMVEMVWLKWLIAVLPVIPVGFALRAFLRYLAQIDEYQQRIQLQAIGFAAGATGIVSFTLGLLENVGFPNLSMVWVLPMLIAFWGIASVWSSRRDR
jgi:hypothetical protein